MKVIIVFGLLTLTCSTRSWGQNKDLMKIADSISNEGKALYKSEWTSWYGTDIFSGKCKERRAMSGGYISYDTGQGLNNIFFSKGQNPVVLATISFGYDLNSNNYKLDTVNRKFSPVESELYTIRQTALAEINKDTLFKRYNHTSLNLVPIIHNNSKRVYVLTGAEVNGVVILGNDYLIDFDQNNSIVSKKRLHKNIIPIEYGKDSSNVVVASMHTHLPESGEFITATDICTLMLYDKFTTWNQHIVMSKNFTSIWDCKKNMLAILTKEAWEKMNPAKSALENTSH
jgi:hypothetical protein